MNPNEMEYADYQAQCQAEAEAEGQAMQEQAEAEALAADFAQYEQHRELEEASASELRAKMQTTPEDTEYDYIVPAHYKTDKGDYIDQLVREKGAVRAIHFCEDTANKYLWRLGKKPGETEKREQQKYEQYMSRAREIRTKFNCDA